MPTVCAWCQAEIDAGESGSPVSHGICPVCVPKFMPFLGKPLRDFLDDFDGPVFLVDRDNAIITGNRRGLALLGKEPEALVEKRFGDVFECPYAQKAGGCGNSTHCRACTIRLAVAQTAATGKACRQVPAYADLEGLLKNRRAKLLISTEKLGDAVLLRIDDL